MKECILYDSIDIKTPGKSNICCELSGFGHNAPSLGHCPHPLIPHPQTPALSSLNPPHLAILSLVYFFKGLSLLPHSKVTLEGEMSGKRHKEGF